MYSTSLPPSLKSFTLLNGQGRPTTPPQNQRLSGYSADTVHIQQPLLHGDKLQFSGKRIEELKRKRELEAAKVKEQEQAQFKAAMQQQILDEDVNIKLNAYILGKLKVKFPEAYPGTVTPNLKKLEKAACDALRRNPDYPINKLIDDYISNNNDGNARPIKWTLLHKAIYHELPTLVNLILDEHTPDVLIRDSEDISPLNTAEQMADNSDGRWSEAEMRVNQRIYERVKAKHDEQQAEIDKIDTAHKAELKTQADAAAADEQAKNKPKKLSPGARREQQQEKKAKEARLEAEKKKEQELAERFNQLDVPESEPQEEDTEGTWETQKKAKSQTSSPTTERKSQASSPVSTRGDNRQRRSATTPSYKEPKAGKTSQQEKYSGASVTTESPTVSLLSPASSGPAPMPENPWKKPWLESSSKTELSIEAGEDAPKQSIDRTLTAPVASSSKLPSQTESPEEPPIRPLETMRDLSKTLPNLRTSGLASPSTFSYTSSASSLSDRVKIKQLKDQRDEKQRLLEQGSKHARDMQNALNWKDWHYSNLLGDYYQMRQQFLALQQQMMAPLPMMPMVQQQPFVPLNEQQRTQNLQEQENVMQNMEHMQGLIHKLRDTTDPQTLEKMKEDSEQPLAFVPDQSGTGYVIAEGPRAGEWFKELPAEPPKPFKDMGKKFDNKEDKKESE